MKNVNSIFQVFQLDSAVKCSLPATIFIFVYGLLIVAIFTFYG